MRECGLGKHGYCGDARRTSVVFAMGQGSMQAQAESLMEPLPARGSPRRALAFVAAALLLLALGLAVLWTAQGFVADSDRLDIAQSRIIAMTQLQRAERTAIASQRAYLLTGDVSHRDRYWRGLGELDAALAKLRQAVAQGGPAPQVLDGLAEKLSARIARASEVLAAYERDGAQAADRLLRDGRSSELEQGLREEVDRLTEALMQQLASERAKASISSRRLLVAASLGVPIGLLVLAAGFLLLHQEIRNRQLAETARDATERRLQASVADLSSVSRNMQRLSAYAGLLQTCESVEEVLDVSRVSLGALLPQAAAQVFLQDAGSDHLYLVEGWGESGCVSAERLQVAQCWALRRTQPHACDKRNSELRCAHFAEDAAGASLCLPLNAHGSALGLLVLDGPEPLIGEALAVTAAEQLSLALANLRLRDTLREQSQRDPLTGLYNRRHLQRHLSELYESLRSGRQPLAVLMVDLDHFKRYNDLHGHAGGDAVLVAVGELMRRFCQPGEFACRYGGEEFTLLLPGRDLAAAMERAEALRQALRELRPRREGVELAGVTASIGVAALPECATRPEDLLLAADHAAYAAKEAGRDCCVAAPRSVGG